MALTSSRQQQIPGNFNSFNSNNNSFNSIVNFVTEIDDEGHQILRWLSPLEPQQRHQGVRTDRLNSVGNWILETSEFRKWRDAKDGKVEQVLFCYGNPGVGKTFVCSPVIDSLCDQAKGEDVAVVGLYCDFLAQQEQSTTNILGAMLKQLASRGGIPRHIREAFRRAKKEFGGRGLLLPDMIEIAKKAIVSLRRLFICIDALDESPSKHRLELLESLQDIVRVSPNTRVFLTGRPHVDNEIVKYFSKALRIPLNPAYGDIVSYLEMRLKSDNNPHAMDDKLRADVMKIIPKKVSESFLLVSLNMDAILDELTLTRRRKKLDEMTKGEGLGDAYTATLSRIGLQARNRAKLGMEVLMWVSHAERPLRVDELCHALGVEGSIDLDVGNNPTIEIALACSLGLVTVEKSSSTVRLIHYTLQEYLSHNPRLFFKPHSTIAEVCLTYLNFRHVKGFSPALRSVPPTAPFVEYASCYWGIHARWETTENVKTLALKLLDEYDKHISSKMALLRGVRTEEQPFDGEDIPSGFTGLHGAAYFGCLDIMVALLETREGDVGAHDFHGNAVISWAARRGHEGVVRVLLGRSDVSPDTPDTKYGRTPLSWAAENGHEGVVRTLLERKDVGVESADKWNKTPLYKAVAYGREGVVRILLEQGRADPNTADTIFGQTLLSWAAEHGHKGVVKILLERNYVDADKADHCGQTPLSLAANSGHEGVVRMLLGRDDVDANKADGLGRTPLLRAAKNGHEKVARMLVERSSFNLDIVIIDHGRTLSWAVASRREEIVRVFLERSSPYSDIPGTEYGQALLLWAAANGNELIVRMLLEQSNVSSDKTDRWGRTPLSWAARNGHEGVVRTLLERNDVDLEKSDKSGQTPLLWAAANGHEGVIRTLLEQIGLDPDTADTKYGQVLSWAAANGHAPVVRILLERTNVNFDEADGSGRTLLSLAIKNQQEGVLRVLLERFGVGANTADTEYDRALSWASTNGHEAIVRALLERSDLNPDKGDKLGETPLLRAVANRHEGVVRILLERKGVNPNTGGGRYDRTPLSLAAASGHEGIVRTLLERKHIHPDKADRRGQTPLLWAAGNGHEGVVKLLLKRNDINPNTADSEYGRTPLLLAANSGHEGIVRTLLERRDIDPFKADRWGQTPLLKADSRGRKNVVRILVEWSNVTPGEANK